MILSIYMIPWEIAGRCRRSAVNRCWGAVTQCDGEAPHDLDVKTSRGCAWTATAVRPALLRLDHW